MHGFAKALLGFEGLGFVALVSLCGPAIGWIAAWLSDDNGWAMGLAMFGINFTIAVRLGRHIGGKSAPHR